MPQHQCWFFVSRATLLIGFPAALCISSTPLRLSIGAAVIALFLVAEYLSHRAITLALRVRLQRKTARARLFARLDALNDDDSHAASSHSPVPAPMPVSESAGASPAHPE